MQSNFQVLIDDLVRQFWGVSRELFSAESLQTLRNEALAHHSANRTHPAGVGKELQLIEEVRKTHIRWFEPLAMSPAENAAWLIFEALREALNRACFLSLVSCECHFAVYPVGSFYRRHLDQFQKQNTRQISFVLYLNPDWGTQDGGELRLFLPGQSEGVHVDIPPEMGCFAVFRSAEVEHEVMMTHKERVCVVGWMRTRDETAFSF